VRFSAPRSMNTPWTRTERRSRRTPCAVSSCAGRATRPHRPEVARAPPGFSIRAAARVAQSTYGVPRGLGSTDRARAPKALSSRHSACCTTNNGYGDGGANRASRNRGILSWEDRNPLHIGRPVFGSWPPFGANTAPGIEDGSIRVVCRPHTSGQMSSATTTASLRLSARASTCSSGPTIFESPADQACLVCRPTQLAKINPIRLPRRARPLHGRGGALRSPAAMLRPWKERRPGQRSMPRPGC